MKNEFDWYDENYVPDNPCLCLCEVEGVPFTKYMVLKWNGEYWMMWNYFNEATQGWVGFFSACSVVRWCLIEEEQE